MLIIRILLFLAFLYVLLAIYAYFFSDASIFPAFPASYQDTNKIIKVKTKDGALISAIYLPNPQARFTLLVSHGNGEDLGMTAPYLEELQQQGFAVFSYDYHGYGTSTGKATEANTYQDSVAAYDYLTQVLKIDPQHIIAYGSSLGAALAIDLATHKPVAAVILVSPFLTAFRTVTYFPILPFDKYDNLKKIKNIHVPVLIFHGTQDEVIPFWHGKTLYENANQPKEFMRVEGAGHNNLVVISNQRFWSTIKNFVNKYFSHTESAT